MHNDKEARKIQQPRGDDDPLNQDYESLDNSVIERSGSKIQDSAGKVETNSPATGIKPSLLQKLLSCLSCSQK